MNAPLTHVRTAGPVRILWVATCAPAVLATLVPTVKLISTIVHQVSQIKHKPSFFADHRNIFSARWCGLMVFSNFARPLSEWRILYRWSELIPLQLSAWLHRGSLCYRGERVSKRSLQERRHLHRLCQQLHMYLQTRFHRPFL